MKTLALFVWLISLGLQLEIIIVQQAFNRPLIGPTEDLFIFFGVAPIQALLLVLWFVAALKDVEHDVHHQEDREDRADWGQSSSLPDVGGKAVSDLITSFPDRIGVIVSAYRRFASRFTIIAFALLALVLLLLASLAGQ